MNQEGNSPRDWNLKTGQDYGGSQKIIASQVAYLCRSQLSNAWSDQRGLIDKNLRHALLEDCLQGPRVKSLGLVRTSSRLAEINDVRERRRVRSSFRAGLSDDKEPQSPVTSQRSLIQQRPHHPLTRLTGGGKKLWAVEGSSLGILFNTTPSRCTW